MNLLSLTSANINNIIPMIHSVISLNTSTQQNTATQLVRAAAHFLESCVTHNSAHTTFANAHVVHESYHDKYRHKHVFQPAGHLKKFLSKKTDRRWFSCWAAAGRATTPGQQQDTRCDD
jgi:hypothetical protein